ncbi:hypothetical protein IKN40_00390 [bacterium]|nr:hypothetical protein [bacterium]
MKKKNVQHAIKMYENVMHSVEIIKSKQPKIVKTAIEMYENVLDLAVMESLNLVKNVTMVQITMVQTDYAELIVNQLIQIKNVETEEILNEQNNAMIETKTEQ